MKKVLFTLLIAAATLMAQEVSTYLYAPFAKADSVKQTLSSHGFTTVGEYDAMGDPNYHIVVYTSDELKSMASKKDRGFAAVQKVLVDAKDHTLVLTNPDYFERAFMQKDLDEAKLAAVSKRLHEAFPTLTPSKQKLKKSKLAGYHFMFGMPYYEDMITVAKGDNLAAKLEKNAGSRVVFKLPLQNATLYGVYMDTKDGEKHYVTKLHQEKHCAFLPYMVLIEGNKAKILNAKYYLAISLPDLSMGQFMRISSTPGHIEDFFESLFK